MDESLCVRVQVFGKVQGVWYRESTRKKAEELGVKGWVRNRADGSVEALLQGPAAAVHALVAWCHQGPPLAEVTQVVAQPCTEECPTATAFVVRRD
ncbi:MAG: acylphosphatase [Magnetococcales bacterium]|nr:acylphosphatase [Magnetococcales bacterium]NGZ28513.1 acylphosphatase [Magnetococcales bacterium]